MKFLKNTILLSFLSAGFLQATAQTNKVGVNTTSPTEILDVNGTMRVRDLPVNGSTNAIYNGSNTKQTTYTSKNIVVADANGVLGIGESITQPLKWFYMPPMNLPIDTSDPAYSAGVFTVNLYNEYKRQFTNPVKNALMVSNTALNIYDADKLDYYVLYYDTKVFENVSISDVGELKYSLKTGGTVTPDTFFTIIYRVR